MRIELDFTRRGVGGVGKEKDAHNLTLFLYSFICGEEIVLNLKI